MVSVNLWYTGLMPRARVSVPPHARKVDVQKKRTCWKEHYSVWYLVLFGDLTAGTPISSESTEETKNRKGKPENLN